VVPPAVLALGVAVVSVDPQLAVDLIVQGAVEATARGTPEFSVHLPDHVTPPVIMSAVAIVGGVGAYSVTDRIASAIDAVRGSTVLIRPSGWYDRALSGTERAGARVGPLVHTGVLRTYVVWGLATVSALVLAGYVATSASVPAFDGLGVPLIVALVLLIALLAGFAVPTAPSHVAGVLTLSILGFMLAIFFIVASAPDLALTQLVVETLVLLIFLLVLQRLPEFYADLDRFVVGRDVVLSLVVGVMAFVSTLLVSPDPAADPTELAQYYVTEAVPEGGGTNVVNVVLVDFRGFDTMGELVVVTIAAVSVLVLVTMRTRGETQ